MHVKRKSEANSRVLVETENASFISPDNSQKQSKHNKSYLVQALNKHAKFELVRISTDQNMQL